MPWPTLSDYQSAIQNPAICFKDPDLKGGIVENGPLGIPRPISGQFVVVFKVSKDNRTYATRCFQSNVTDLFERYHKIDLALRSSRLPYFVDFTYLNEGILISGKWYPVLRMAWTPGMSIMEYIKANITNPSNLRMLADKWVRMSKDLDNNKIAHGDFQHGNVIVSNGDIKLIDYDGMYVPAIQNLKSRELGQRNYQHPKRNENHFDIWLDNFSSWVIYISLIACSIDPVIWDISKAGDECLVFRKEDFENPCNSKVFSILLNHSNETLKKHSHQLVSFLSQPMEKIPFLHHLIDERIIHPGDGSWLNGFLPQRIPTTSTEQLSELKPEQIPDLLVNLSEGKISRCSSPPLENQAEELQLTEEHRSCEWIYQSQLYTLKKFINPVLNERLWLIGLLIIGYDPYLRYYVDLSPEFQKFSILINLSAAILIWFLYVIYRFHKDPNVIQRNKLKALENEQQMIAARHDTDLAETKIKLIKHKDLRDWVTNELTNKIQIIKKTIKNEVNLIAENKIIETNRYNEEKKKKEFQRHKCPKIKQIENEIKDLNELIELIRNGNISFKKKSLENEKLGIEQALNSLFQKYSELKKNDEEKLNMEISSTMQEMKKHHLESQELKKGYIIKQKNEFVNNEIKKVQIRIKTIPGIGEKTIEKLAAGGVRFASDIHKVQIHRFPQITNSQKMALLNWKFQEEKSIGKQAPSTLTPGNEKKFNEDFLKIKTNLENRLSILKNEQSKLQSKYLQKEIDERNNLSFRKTYLMSQIDIIQGVNKDNLQTSVNQIQNKIKAKTSTIDQIFKENDLEIEDLKKTYLMNIGRLNQQNQSIEEKQKNYLKKTHLEYKEKVDKIDNDILSLSSKCDLLKSTLNKDNHINAKLSADLRSFEKLSFSNYFRRIFFLKIK